MLRDALLGVKLATLIVDEGGHLVLCCIGVGNDDCDKVDHIHAHNSNVGWPCPRKWTLLYVYWVFMLKKERKHVDLDN